MYQRRRIFGAACSAALAAGMALPGYAADVELVINLNAGGALSLRSTTGSAFDIAGYSLVSTGGFLSDTGDETLGGQLSPLLFDVDNVGSDEVTMWTLGGGGFNPDLALPASPASQALNLAWIGGGDPLLDLTLEYGLSDPLEPPVATADLVVINPVPGDYDASGTVEQGDLDLVLLNWGDPATPVPAGWVNQLPTGLIDQDELDGVLLNWGNTSEPGSVGVAVPEPSAMIATCLAGLGLLGRRNVRI
ncbi:MAG: PEP-CTERM sorting domain-containing protein [Pseudanabaenales cyanobacterium]|nr:PEP-CTERM sorting domain-containing protein [Pseudanabaenales cyanobacterium]